MRELACVQVIVSRHVLSANNVSAFFQTDGGHTGQEVSLFLMYNHKQNKAEQIWAGCTNVDGKLSAHVANGTRQRMRLFFKSENQRLDSIYVGSGQGTPESLSKCLQRLNLLSQFFCADSCGLHNIQSVLRLPILLCIGSGGLNNDDAIQLLHTMYVFHVENCSYW